NIATTSHWYLMQQNPCRTGAQMLWSVQDGPSRMNQCGILPNTKAMVLDSAVNKGLALGMRYLEIYGSDITDVSLNSTIQQANNDLIAEGLSCQSITVLNENKSENIFSIFPNPANNYLTIHFEHNHGTQVQILNSLGILVKEFFMSEPSKIDTSDLPKGLYLIHSKTPVQHTTKFIKE
ncbi:MAG: T9SS type A sorting domain-containing protein, partial [Actinomycetales bacterium]